MTLSWLSIVRLGLVQMALGAIVVLTTSTLNRLMVVELALPAVVPGLLVALHYGIQITRPSWGFASDAGGNRTRWIVGGMAALACGGFGAALGVVVIPDAPTAGLALSVLAYALIGLGVGASGTSLLALLATGTRPDRRAAAAMVTWMMMIAGIAVTAATVGALLDPYTPARLLRIVAVVTTGAVAMTWLAMRGIERRTTFAARPRDTATLRQGLAEVWSEPRARNFTVFVFLSMTAYFMQELILEPYAGLVFGFTPGQSTTLSGTQNAGVLIGMATVGVASSALRLGTLRFWVAAGCLLSAAALGLVAVLGQGDPRAPAQRRRGPARLRQRRLRRRRHRLDDAARRRRPRPPRRHAHGPLGRRAGAGRRLRRPARRRPRRRLPRHPQRRRRLRRRLRHRGRALPRGGAHGAQDHGGAAGPAARRAARAGGVTR